MKDDRKYLDEMWSIVSRLQIEEHQKQAARKKNRFLLLLSAMIYSALAALFFLFISIPYAKTSHLLTACSAMLVIGFCMDGMLYHRFRLEDK